MLAYVFWHWPSPQLTAATYQEPLINFHQVLAAHRSPGFHYSRVLLSERAPWPRRDAETYEDWYIVEDSAALDPLDKAAVSGPCLEPHNAVACLAEGGTGGLYRLRFGELRLPTVRFACWFNKPAGMRYAELDALVQPLVERTGGTFWLRQMTLGPATECCLHCPVAVSLPERLEALMVSVQQIWHN